MKDKGDIIWNSDYMAMQYCDGTDWIEMGKADAATCDQPWTERTAAEANTWMSVTYGNGTFVAVSTTGTNRVMTSPDGINWTAQTPPVTGEWRTVAYGAGLFVAMSQLAAHQIITSPDGVTWTARTPPVSESWGSVVYGGGQFVAVSQGGNNTLRSTDGITWTNHTPAQTNSWRSVTYGNGLYVAVSQNGTNEVMTSPDGINWTARAEAASSLWNSVTYGNGMFVAVGDTGASRVMTSPDGINWTARTAAEANSWLAVTFAKGLFVAVAGGGTNVVMTSPNGINWTADAAVGWSWSSIVYGGDKFVAVSQNFSGRVMTSPCTGSCSNPAGTAGEIMYNHDYRVPQYCNGTQWVAMKEPPPGSPPGGVMGSCSNPAHVQGTMMYNDNCSVMQFCDGADWQTISKTVDECAGDCGPPDPCVCGTPSPGDVCGDGSVYAGLSPDGNVPMFTTPADAGLLPYNNGNSSGYVGQVANDYVTGAANTLVLVATDSDSVTGGHQPHRAALYCHCLGKDTTGDCASDPTSGANGYGNDDWYLPSLDELHELCTNRVAIGAFDQSGNYGAGTYRAALDDGGNADADYLGFSDCSLGGAGSKPNNLNVRCVRKD